MCLCYSKLLIRNGKTFEEILKAYHFPVWALNSGYDVIGQMIWGIAGLNALKFHGVFLFLYTPAVHEEFKFMYNQYQIWKRLEEINL
jgi:hypothetical protein